MKLKKKSKLKKKGGKNKNYKQKTFKYGQLKILPSNFKWLA